MRVYLAGPIEECGEAETHLWRDLVTEKLVKAGFEVADPSLIKQGGDDEGAQVEMVNTELAELEQCDVLLANVWKVGIGTPMEIVVAANLGLEILVVWEKERLHPWLRYYADQTFKSVDEAVDFIVEEWA